MKNKLQEILDNKLEEIKEKKKRKDIFHSLLNPKVGDIAIIAEIKLHSPSMGKLGEEKEIISRVKEYEKYYADAISIVVDQKYFGGKPEYINLVKEAVSLPILAKDFVIDSFQIYELKSYGADAILLIAKILSKDELIEYVDLSIEVGLEPVVEVQNEEELLNAQSTNTRIIAVNARDLVTFEVNIDKACKLFKTIPNKYLTLGFSGVVDRDSFASYKKAGAIGVLVGASLMKTNNIKEFLMSLRGS